MFQEAHQRQKKQKSNYWQRIKNDPVKFGHYKEWRKQYVNKKKEKEAPSPIVVAAVPFEKVRENIISQITDLMCRVDWQDHELRNVWTALELLLGRGQVQHRLIDQTQNLISAGTPLVAGQDRDLR